MTLEIIHTLSSHVKGAKTGFAHIELLGQHFSTWSFAIRVHLLLFCIRNHL